MRILFFHQGRINDWAGAVLNGLKGQFPQAEVLVFDLHRLLKERPTLLARNAVATGMRYGLDLALGKRDLDDAFFTTEYIFHKVREISTEIHEKYPSDFSFQMHSMHDHSSPERPHFVYTDFTYQSCRKSQFYKKFKWVPERSDELIELERGIYKRSACIFSQTQAVVRTLVEEYGISAEKAMNVRYGPNISAANLGTLNDWNTRHACKTVLFIGGDWVRKGGPELVKAFERVQHDLPHAKLVILGCEPLLVVGLAEVVGKVPLSALPGYFGDASVFCMPSKLEPSAGVYVEAMHAGLPVIALDADETREVVSDGETGYLVRAGDIGSLSSRILELLSSPELCETMGARGRDFAVKNHTWEQTFERVGLRIRHCLGGC